MPVRAPRPTVRTLRPPARAHRPRLGPAFTLLVLLTAPAAHGDPPPLPGPDRMGLSVQSMTPELRRHFAAPEDRGLLVTRVVPGRPAARAGIEVGDVLLEAGREPLRRTYDLVRIAGRAEVRRPLPVTLLRDGKRREVEVVPEGIAAPWPDPGPWAEWLERAVELGSEQLRDQLQRMEKRLEELERELERERERREGAERT